MRETSALILLLCSTSALAQNYYIPDNNAAAGISNVIPFGTASPSNFSNCRMHVRATPAELGNLPNLITGLGFAPSNSGIAHFDSLIVVMDHIPASQPLSTTFANNLTAAATTVLSVTDYNWHLTGSTWNEVGLQNSFVYNGVDDLVIEVTTAGASSPSGMRRGTNQRIYATSANGPAPTTGVSSNSATKFEVSMLTARTSLHGRGCAGANGTPTHSLVGSAQVGTTLSFDLANGPSASLAVLLAGYNSAAPFPIELTALNMPGCYAYNDPLFNAGLALDASGAASFPFAIPTSAVGFLFYSQYACLDVSANAFGLTTSNYGRIYTGN